MLTFLKRIQSEILVLDGSMGAFLQERGLPAGIPPDLWTLDAPDKVREVHRLYVNAGADIILSNTFGATRPRLSEYGGNDVEKVNIRAVEVAREAAGDRCLVAGDIGPSGLMTEPVGESSFDFVVSVFEEQIKALLKGGVDILVIETMFDIQEIRAAVIAANQHRGDIPLIVHATFNQNHMMDTGTDPETFATIAEGFKIDAIGLNCSVGPDSMLSTLKRLRPATQLPISVQPNAGIPELKRGKPRFPLDADTMASFVEPFVSAGANIIGGCCGTTPEYVRKLSAIIKKMKPRNYPIQPSVRIASRSQTLHFGTSHPFVKIGERINPTGRKKLADAIRNRQLQAITDEADAQIQAGAMALDVNVGVPSTKEPEIMKQVIRLLQETVSVPLVIDSSDPAAFEAALKIYPGRCLLNSVNADDDRLAEILPMVKKYGSALIALPMGDRIPKTVSRRLDCARKIIETCRTLGIGEENIILDALALTVSAMQDASIQTLFTIREFKQQYSLPVIIGLSNVSFGLPSRSLVQNAFIAQAISHGLDGAILNPLDPQIHETIEAASLFSSKDPGCVRFIETRYGKTGENEPESTRKTGTPVEKSPPEQVYDAVFSGNRGKIEAAVSSSLDDGIEPLDLFSQYMTPAIKDLGELYGKGKRFLPHLIAAAETMKRGMKILTPLLESSKSTIHKGTVVFATVKGDMHDIGKNICILQLRNFGYRVVDLGKNVSVDDILNSVQKHNADIIALSALMTTTMTYMETVVDRVYHDGFQQRVMIGGAAVTQAYADEIGAHGYCRDMGGIAELADRLIKTTGKPSD